MKNHSKTRIELQKAPMGQFHCRFHTQSMVTVPHPVFQTFKKHQKTHKQSSAWFFHGFYPGFSPEEASLTMAGIWWLLWSLQSSTRPKKAQLVYSNAESRDKKIIRNDPKRCCSIYIYIYQWHINDLWWFMMIYDDLWWFIMIYGDLWWFMGHFLCTANAKIHCQCLMQIIHCVFEKKDPWKYRHKKTHSV